MRKLAASSLFALAAGYSLAHFLVLFYNHWYFCGWFWLKAGLLTPVLALGFAPLLYSSWGKLWRILGWYWIGTYLIAAVVARSLYLGGLGFTNVLNYEAAVAWTTILAVGCYAWARSRHKQRELVRGQREVAMLLSRRRRIREARQSGKPGAIALLLALTVSAAIMLAAAPARADEEPRHLFPNRHEEMKDPQKRIGPEQPAWPGQYPVPLQLRARELFRIVIENKVDGAITIFREAPADSPVASVPAPLVVGHVLAPVTQVNPKGYTASGWALPGTVCASAVNAIHIKSDHDYAAGKGVIFSLTPLEFADFNASEYKSYFNKSSSLYTDIPAGKEIFGGQWAPLVGGKVLLAPGGDIAQAAQLTPGYVPKDGDTLVIEVARRKYNPEWVEFENSFGGLIWVKELGMEPYPIGQVLKPVAGVGRFLGTQYAGLGRIRASHPGVLCISTTPIDTIGGFQIIPRDHAMSEEMTNARVKTQWMVVGPLWALDPSWEGLPPLFNDYFYPAFTPALNPDGSVNEDRLGAEVFLDRFTVRARYSDAEDPAAYVLMKPTANLDNFALKFMTHLRVYFPRGDV
jgi:hypothetical protein